MILPELPYISRFATKKGGHGGNRRTRQIAESLESIGVMTINLSRPTSSAKSTTKLSSLHSLDKEFNSLYDFNIYISSQLNADETLATAICSSKIKGAVVDDPIFFPKTMREMAIKNIPTVSIIHNIESFVPRSMTIHPQWSLLKDEVNLINNTNLSVTIAREDTWLLRNFGMKCYYHPYYPPVDTEAELAKIRIARRKSHKKFFLCMGTAYNPPTLFGMQILINSWSNLMHGKIPLIIAGYGVDGFFDQPPSTTAITIVGEVSHIEMTSLLTECIACILHQETGSGALTKIPELLRSGIPIIASQHAARSYEGTEGLYEYQELAEIPKIMQDIIQGIHSTPYLPKPDEKRLLTRVTSALRL